MSTPIHTSVTDPLQIAELPAGNGIIGLTFCPGKCQSNAMSGSWQRDLATDIAAIIRWGATSVVTLMETSELVRYQVPALGEAVEAAGLEWHHLPIRDGGTPDMGFELHWHYVGLRLRHQLANGGRVLLHCRGGLGRTGMIAARLLVELGHTAGEAISVVRAVRPGAIETLAQERYVEACGPVSSDAEISSRRLGSLLGGAAGDAFGYVVEFDSLMDIHKRYGKAGLTRIVLTGDKFVVSDDTQMTLFTAEGLLRGLDTNLDLDSAAMTEAVRRSYLDWLATQGEEHSIWEKAGHLCERPRLRHRRAPGHACLSALKVGGHGTPAHPINESKGCGGVMRAAPYGWVPGVTVESAYQGAKSAAALTHGHPDGFLSAGAMAAIIHQLMGGADFVSAARTALELLKADFDAAKGSLTGDKITTALALAEAGLPAAEAIATLGEGWVGEEAIAIGLYAALVGESFGDVLALAANHDGDSDSTASIAAQIWGAWKGIHQIPNAYIRHLDVLDEALEIAAHPGWKQ